MTALSFTQVEIDGFRGLRSLHLENLGRVNILVGSNNCGKTSVLEALSVLCQPQNPQEWVRMVRRRDFGGLDETIVQSLRWCFAQTIPTDYNMLVEASCKFKCEGNFPLRELRVRYKEFTEIISESIRERMIKRPGIRYTFAGRLLMGEDSEYRGAEIKHSPVWLKPDSTLEEELGITFKVTEIENTYVRNRKQTYFLESKTLSPYSYQINRMQLRSQSEQLFNDDRVSELLKKFDSDIEAIRIGSFSGDRPAIYIKHRKLGEAPLSVFGDAMRRTVLLTTTLLSLKAGGLLFIDEVEAGIHVSGLANVFNWLVEAARKLEIQLFVTTHSLEALDTLISANSEQTADDIVVYQLTQTEERTENKRFSGDLLHSLRFDSGLDVR